MNVLKAMRETALKNIMNSSTYKYVIKSSTYKYVIKSMSCVVCSLKTLD